MSIKSTVLTSLAVLSHYQIDQDKVQVADKLPLLADDRALFHFYYELVMHYGSHLETAGRNAFEEEVYAFLVGLFDRCKSLSDTQGS